MLFGLEICISAVAQTPVVPRSAFNVGVGGSYNSTDFGTQHVNAIGTSQVFESGMLVSTGRAAGPGIVKMPIESNFAPSVQAGYFRQIAKGPWLWRPKFSYNYLNTTSSVDNVVVPQFGSFTELATHTTVPFIGAAIARSYQTQLDHQLELMPSSGTSWGKVLCTWASARRARKHKQTSKDSSGSPTSTDKLPMSWVHPRISPARDGWLGVRVRSA
jgi:hypothetical protein